MARPKKVKVEEPAKIAVEEKETLNDIIIEKSNIYPLGEIQIVDNPVFEVPYLEFNYNKESDTISLEKQKQTIQVSTSRVGTHITSEQAKEFKDKFNLDLNEVVKKALINEASQQLTKHYISKIGEAATENYIKEYTRWDKFKVWAYKLVKKQYRKKIKIQTSKELNYRILKEANNIAANSRWGSGNFVICSLKTAMLLQSSSNFVYATLNKPVSTNGSIYPIGTIAGVTIYVDPYMLYQDTNVYIGRRNNTNQPGIKLFFKESYSYMQTEGLGAPKVILEMRYAIAGVGKNYKDQYRKFEYIDKIINK